MVSRVATPTKNDTPTSTRARGQVTVACRLPAGLKLRLHRMVEKPEQSPLGMRTVKQAEAYGEPVNIRGYYADLMPAFAANMPIPSSPGGYALTHGVDAEFWAQWREQNCETEIVKNRLIYAYDTTDAVMGEMRDNEKVRSGLEPLDPANLPVAVRGIKTADEMRKRMERMGS